MTIYERDVDSPGIPVPEKGRRLKVSFRTKFLLGTGVILLFFSALSAILLYQQGKQILEETARAKSELVMASVESVQGYVRDVLRPKMFEMLGQDSFLLEAMSTSYVSRVVMDKFNKRMPEYLYSRVAVDARNPDSEAGPEEIAAIRHFSSNPESTELQKIINIGDKSYSMHYRPVRFSTSCLHCHGDPAEAPAALIERYGDRRGFWRKDRQIAGISAVGIPVNAALAQVRQKALSVFIGGFALTVVLFLVIGFYFNRVVIHDLRSLLEVFRASLRKDEEESFFGRINKGDELATLKAALKSMALHLRDSRRQLEANAEKLEHTVAERTSELRESELRLRDQVIARNLELKTLNTLAEMTTKPDCLSDVYPKTLEETLRLVPAAGAGFYLIQQDGLTLDLVCHRNAPELIDRTVLDRGAPECSTPGVEIRGDVSDSLSEAARGGISFFEDPGLGRGLNVPLCCRGRVLGALAFVGVDREQITPHFMELLFSIGRQIGIAIESLQTTRKFIQSKELLQSVFDGITDMVILMDSDLKIKMVNKAYLKRYGLPEDKVLGQACNELHAGDLCRIQSCGVKKALATRAPVVEEVVSGSGEIFLMHFYPVSDEQGEVVSIVRYARDITDQKRVEQQIQRTEKLASLGQLAAGVAHEINNPLGVILCYTSLLKHQVEQSSQVFNDVGTIEKHALTCTRIVSDMLKFARSEPGSKEMLTVNRLVDEVIQMVGHQFGKQGVEVVRDLDPELPAVSADADKIKQVFMNLFVNSRQAISGKGVVRVETSYLEEGRRVQIVFDDNGSGIPKEIQSKIFDPFFTTKGPGEGTGLGLSVSYGIIRDHGGEIFVKSEPGEGARFTIQLPVGEQ